MRVAGVLVLAPLVASLGLLVFWQQAWPSAWHHADFVVAAGPAALAEEAQVMARLGAPPAPPTGLWHLQAVRAPEAWAELERRGWRPVTVGLWDGVLDPTHPDLAHGVVAMQPEDPLPYALRWLSGDNHGTALWGIIAGRGLPGMTGVNPRARVVAMGTHTQSKDASVGASLRFFAQHGARAANYSIAAGHVVVGQEEVDAAYHAGVLPVTGLPNSDTDQPVHPAALYRVLVVSGSDGQDRPADNGWGPLLDVLAPAPWPLTTAPRLHVGPLTIGAPYRPLCCNSVSVGIVTGVASLIAAADPTLTSAQIEKRIKLSARKPPGMAGETWHPRYGYGVVDAYRAITYDTRGPEVAVARLERAGAQTRVVGGIIDETDDDKLAPGRDRDQHLRGVPVSNIARVELRGDGAWVAAKLEPVQGTGATAAASTFRFEGLVTGSGPVTIRAWDTAGNLGPEVTLGGP